MKDMWQKVYQKKKIPFFCLLVATPMMWVGFKRGHKSFERI
jgi:hypothetical protein